MTLCGGGPFALCHCCSHHRVLTDLHSDQSKVLVGVKNTVIYVLYILNE